MDEAAHIAPSVSTFSYTGATPLESVREGGHLTVRREGTAFATFHCIQAPDSTTVLKAREMPGGEPGRMALMAALEALFVAEPSLDRVQLRLPADLERICRETGVAVHSDGGVAAPAELFWQRSELWHTASGREPFPQMHVLTNGRRAPDPATPAAGASSTPASSRGSAR